MWVLKTCGKLTVTPDRHVYISLVLLPGNITLSTGETTGVSAERCTAVTVDDSDMELRSEKTIKGVCRPVLVT